MKSAFHEIALTSLASRVPPLVRVVAGASEKGLYATREVKEASHAKIYGGGASF